MVISMVKQFSDSISIFFSFFSLDILKPREVDLKNWENFDEMIFEEGGLII